MTNQEIIKSIDEIKMEVVALFDKVDDIKIYSPLVEAFDDLLEAKREAERQIYEAMEM